MKTGKNFENVYGSEEPHVISNYARGMLSKTILYFVYDGTKLLSQPPATKVEYSFDEKTRMIYMLSYIPQM